MVTVHIKYTTPPGVLVLTGHTQLTIKQVTNVIHFSTAGGSVMGKMLRHRSLQFSLNYLAMPMVKVQTQLSLLCSSVNILQDCLSVQQIVMFLQSPLNLD